MGRTKLGREERGIRGGVLLAVGVMVGGCPLTPPVDIPGVEGNVRLFSVQDEDPNAEDDWVGPHVEAIPYATYDGAQPVLEGTTMCLSWGHEWDATTPTPDCWLAELDQGTGPAPIQSGECIDFGPDVSLFTFTAQDCASGATQVADDWVELQGRRADQVKPRLVPWPELLAVPAGTITATDPGLLTVHEVPYPASMLVAAGSPVRVRAGLFDADDEGMAVAWNLDRVRLTVGETEGTVRERGDASSTRVGAARNSQEAFDHTLRLELDRDATAEVRASLGDDEWGAAELVAVDAGDEAVSIDIAAMIDANNDIAARAYVRTADGDLIHGVPVRWSFEGLAMEFGVANAIYEVWAGPDYVDLADTCSRPSLSTGERSGTLVATFGDLRAELDLVWTNGAPVTSDQGWTRPARCRSDGCSGCSASPSSGPALWLLALLALGLGRRGRRPPV